MNEQPQPKMKSKQKTVTVKLEFDVYAYPCALCGKPSVGWDVNGAATVHPANDKWIQVPLKHAVCGQVITLDIKLEELKVKQDDHPPESNT